MSEDQTLCGTKKGKVESTPISQDEIEKAERAQAVQLEIEKIHTLPDDYWPAEWRKHVRALSITGLALVYWMADKGKGHESSLVDLHMYACPLRCQEQIGARHCLDGATRFLHLVGSDD